MSLNQPVGVPYQNPRDYVGPNANLVPIRRFPRRPVSTDRKYRIGQFAILGKNPTSGTYGELWYLASFESNGDANWIMFDTSGTNLGIVFIETDDGPPAVGQDGLSTVNVFGGTGIITSGQDPSTTVTISIDSSVVGETLTGDSGGALSPTAGKMEDFKEFILQMPMVARIGFFILLSGVAVVSSAFLCHLIQLYLS